MNINSQYTYLLINIGTILFPFILSFDEKVAFYRDWKKLFTGICIAGAVFLFWDIIFTYLGVWEFNYKYIIGYKFLLLPIEEWLFFLTVPYSTIFVYRCWSKYTNFDYSIQSIFVIFSLLQFVFLILLFVYINQLYTFVTFLGCFIFHLLFWIKWKSKFLGDIYISWLINLIPFMLVNGILTALPVVMYNDAENMGLRIYTIPFEDIFYGFLLFLINLFVFHSLERN